MTAGVRARPGKISKLTNEMILFIIRTFHIWFHALDVTGVVWAQYAAAWEDQSQTCRRSVSDWQFGSQERRPNKRYSKRLEFSFYGRIIVFLRHVCLSKPVNWYWLIIKWSLAWPGHNSDGEEKRLNIILRYWDGPGSTFTVYKVILAKSSWTLNLLSDTFGERLNFDMENICQVKTFNI